MSFTVKKESFPLEKAVLDIAFDYIELQNSYISQMNENPNEKPVIDDKLKAKFSKVVQEVQKAKDRPEKPTAANSPGLDLVLSHASVQPFVFPGSEACGGGFDNPHPNREDEAVWVYTVIPAREYFVFLGFHLTAIYASGFDNNRDFTKEVYHTEYSDEPKCMTGQFRLHGIVHHNDERIYKIQNVEPNAEILGYDWPEWWWGGYMHFWHDHALYL